MIEKAGPEHVMLLGLVAEEVFAPLGERAWQSKEFAQLLSLPTCHAWLAHSENQVFGYILASAVGNEAELLSLAVMPQSRGKGIGTRLICYLVEWARERGVSVIHLEVADNNQAAIALYRKFGFVDIGQRSGYYDRPGGRLDARKMAMFIELSQALPEKPGSLY